MPVDTGLLTYMQDFLLKKYVYMIRFLLFLLLPLLKK